VSTKQRIPASKYFQQQNGTLHAEAVPLDEIAAHVGTPAYVYSQASLHDAYRSVDAALADVPHMVAYAVKANGNLALLSRLARWGCGADIVSGGELMRARKAGFAPDKIVFSGVGKSDSEIQAALEAGIRSLHVESAPEIEAVERIAQDMGVTARIALRVNPDVDAATHPYISTGLHSSKFGIELGLARELLPRLVKSEHVRLEGVACHIGSMVLSPEPISDAVAITAEFAAECIARGAPITTLDAGGGWPILYGNEAADAASHNVFGRAIIDGIRRGGAADLGLTLLVEPGRALVGDAGVLLTRVLYVKEQVGKRFVIVDAAMTELIRPALYSAYHAISPVNAASHASESPADVVGPVCESADFFAKDRPLPPLRRGDLLAIRGSGAYSASMGSNYNGRPLAPEVLVDGGGFQVVRARQKPEDMWRDERGSFE
jgi:diaminopimelate decarboxylase